MVVKGCWTMTSACGSYNLGGSATKTAWESFRSFNRDAVVFAATHALAVVRSHYPATDLEAIGGGYAKGLSKAETQRLEDEVEDAAKKLAGDIYLFRETDGSGEAQ